MTERESSLAERKRHDAEKAAENLERQYRQGVRERPKPKAKPKPKEDKSPEA
jgi:hypothetical protein